MLALILLLCGCKSGVIVQDEVSRRASTGESWTVMLYMCGSKLEEENNSASRVLSSLAYNLPENINVIVETGGSRSWDISDIYSDYQQDFIVQKNGIRLINQSSSKNMGSPDTLTGFLSWSIENYPAQHYMTVIWDHGGGPVGGVAYDSNYKFDSLSLNELKSAFGSLDVKMDIIGFDASLMSNIETASALSLYADYMVASEDIIPSDGWDYKKLFKYLSENPSASPAQVGKEICDGVSDNAADAEEYFVSMAVTDLTKYSKLAQTFDSMAMVMADAADTYVNLRTLQSSLNNLEYLGGNSQWEGYSNLIDTGSLADALENRSERAASNLKTAISDAVVYKKTNQYRTELSGLGVFYPSDYKAAEISKYRDICDSENYLEFIEKTCINPGVEDRRYNYEDSAAWQQYNEVSQDISIDASYDPSGTFSMTSNNIDMFKRAGVNYYMYNKNTGKYVFLYRDYSVEFDSAQKGYSHTVKNKIPMLGGTPVSMYRVSSNKDYDVYSIPVIQSGELKNIRMVKVKTGKKAGTYKFLGVWKGVGKYTGMAEREVTELEAGDVVTPIYEEYGQDTSKYVEGSAVRMGIGTAVINEKQIKDGEYALTYTAEDIYGAEHTSNAVSFNSKKGRITSSK
ncbi:MAG: hypothetical protein J1G06_03205 [Oscillospiraceae bacterium]|nr:hypothetical protein [Oscillospiraceae bacterium]